MNETISASGRVCPQCGVVADVDARFCKQCAFDLSKSIPDLDATVIRPNSPQKASSKRILLIAGIAVGSLLLIVLVGTYVYKRNRAQHLAASSSPTPSLPTMSDRAKQVEDKILRNESLNENDIAGLSAYELRVLRNVHFARYGRKYDQGGDLGGYFYTRPWYKPSDTYNDKQVNATDKENINLILAAEKSVSNSQSDNQRSNAAVATPDIPATSTPPSRSDLSRETVLALAQSRIRKEIVARIDDSSNGGIGNVTDLYTAMMKEKIITCRNYDNTCACLIGCTPGSNSHGLRKMARGMDLTIGYTVPTEVSGISRIDQSSAYADVLSTFRPSQDEFRIYNKYRGAFNAGDLGSNEQHRVFLRLYDDGWRLESWR